MSYAQHMSVEILHNIFTYLPGKDVFKCRRVCKLWYEAVDSLSNGRWKTICLNQIYDPHLAIIEGSERARLPYREMIKSFNLWPKITQNKLSHKELPYTNVNQLKILHNGLLSIVINCNNIKNKKSIKLSDTIVYYDMNMNEEVKRVTLGFPFSKYDENNKLITVIHEDQSLCVIPIANNKKFFVGKLQPNIVRGSAGEYSVLSTDIYFKTACHILTVAQLVEDDEGVTVKTKQLMPFQEQPLAFKYGYAEDDVIILTDEGDIHVYFLEKKVIATVMNIDCTDDVIDTLRYFGFDWMSPSLFRWLMTFYDPIALRVSKTMLGSMVSYGYGLVCGTATGVVNVYVKGIRSNGSLKTYSHKPNISIDMSKLIQVPYKDISQIQIVEKVNGHRLVLLVSGKVVFIEFDFVPGYVEQHPCNWPIEKKKMDSPRTKKPKFNTGARIKNVIFAP